MRSRCFSVFLLFLVASCRNSTAPGSLTVGAETISPTPGSIVFAIAPGLVQIKGPVQATCAPYEIKPALTSLTAPIEVTLTAQVAGNACPADVVWTKGLAVQIHGVAPGRHRVRLVHTTDLSSLRQVLVDTTVVVP